MKLKWQQKTLYSMAVLLLFFSFGFISTAKAQTCDPNSLTITDSITSTINGVYIQGDNIANRSAWYKAGTDYKIFWDMAYPGWSVNDKPLYTYFYTSDVLETYLGGYTASPEENVFIYLNVASTTCQVEPETLIGGFFFKTPPASDLGAGVGTISTDVMGSLLPYIYVIGGLYVGFWLGKKIIALIPKDNTNERADKEIARSEKDIKEYKRIIATLD